MQTSTITVAVLPESKKVQIKIKPRDLEITFYRGSGPGGQHKNKTDSAVRIKHVPSGVIVTSEQERSQHLNREIAMKALRDRLEAFEAQKAYRAREATRAAQVGSGMRGDKRRTIRTQDDEVKDHLTGKTIRYSKYARGHLEEILP